VVYLDIPRLYTYIFHGRNLWGDTFAILHWQRAVTRFTDAFYTRIVTELSKRIPMAAYVRLLSSSDTAASVDAPSAPSDVAEKILMTE
jgi:hypothetical protein